MTVTNFSLVLLEFSTSQNELLLVSSRSISSLISGVLVSSCAGPLVKERTFERRHFWTFYPATHNRLLLAPKWWFWYYQQRTGALKSTVEKNYQPKRNKKRLLNLSKTLLRKHLLLIFYSKHQSHRIYFKYYFRELKALVFLRPPGLLREDACSLQQLCLYYYDQTPPLSPLALEDHRFLQNVEDKMSQFKIFNSLDH